MSYGRAASKQELDPKVVRALARLLTLDLSPEELRALTTAFLNQLAAMESVERFDLKDTVPILKMDARWHE